MIFLGLGSNLGDRGAHLETARRRLGELGAPVLRSSPVVETEPFGVAGQPRFLNQVVEVGWGGTPRGLLEVAKAVERLVGRTETYRWGPREIDVDILVFDDAVVSEPDLVIPHPGLRERRFVRDPLLDLEPGLAAILDL